MNQDTVTFKLSAPKKWVDKQIQQLYLIIYAVEFIAWLIFGHDLWLMIVGGVLYNLWKGLRIYYRYRKSLPKVNTILNNGFSDALVTKVKKEKGSITVTVNPNFKNLN